MLFPKIWIICRVCLQQQDELIDLFDDEIHKNIWILLRDCSGVPVRKNDSFPDKICEACLRRLWKAMTFRMDCQRSHRDLLQKQMQDNAVLYEQENSFELFKATHQHSPKNTIEKPQISCPNKDDGTTLPEAVSDDRTVNENNDQTVKQYCIVTRNAKKRSSLGCENESQSKQPIVLLLKLRNTPKKSSRNETSQLQKLEEETKPTQKKKTRGKLIAEKSNKVVDLKRDKLKLSTKKVKNKSKTAAKIKLKVKEVKKKFRCKFCKKVYKTSELLRHHRNTHRQPHKCKKNGAISTP